MVELPAARVVRVGSERAHGDEAPLQPVLRLAPRAIPRRMAWRLLFGSPIAMFGWLFAAFGMLFVLLFLPEAEWPLQSYDRTTTARVTSVEETSASENDATIYRVHFTFATDDGVEHHGASYTKRGSVAQELSVEYDPDEPSRARVIGMRSKPFAVWVALVVLIFPIVGLAIALPQLRTGRLALRLLRHGVETEGRLVHRENTGTTLNDAPVVAMTFNYQSRDGKTYTTTVKTLSPETLEDDEREKMLYDPFAPERATTLDHLPGSPVVTKDGEIACKPGIAVHVLVMPIATAALLVATLIAIT